MFPVGEPTTDLTLLVYLSLGPTTNQVTLITIRPQHTRSYITDKHSLYSYNIICCWSGGGGVVEGGGVGVWVGGGEIMTDISVENSTRTFSTI